MLSMKSVGGIFWLRTGQPLAGTRMWTECRRRQDLGPPSVLDRALQSQAAPFIGMWYLYYRMYSFLRSRYSCIEKAFALEWVDYVSCPLLSSYYSPHKSL